MISSSDVKHLGGMCGSITHTYTLSLYFSRSLCTLQNSYKTNYLLKRLLGFPFSCLSFLLCSIFPLGSLVKVVSSVPPEISQSA